MTLSANTPLLQKSIVRHDEILGIWNKNIAIFRFNTKSDQRLQLVTRSLNRPCSGSWRKKWGTLLANCTLYSPLCPAHPGRICLVGMFSNYQMMESRYVRLFKTIVWLLYQSILTLSSYSLEGCAWSLFHSPWWPSHTPPCSSGHHDDFKEFISCIWM